MYFIAMDSEDIRIIRHIVILAAVAFALGFFYL